MGRIYNFYPGPATLPLEVLEEAAAHFVEFGDMGMSLLETSHRSPEYSGIHAGAISLIRELLEVPDTHRVLFLQGGATMQFGMVPLNLLGPGASCDFTLTGSWAKKAYEDARRVGDVRVIFDGKETNYTTLPDPASLQVNPEAVYLHMTSNETIGGIQWKGWPDTGSVPIVCDMSSDFMSRRVEMKKFGLIYAGAQKNFGPSGVTVVILREDMLSRCSDTPTAYMRYKIHADKDSLYNTPPVFAIYLTGLVLQWVKRQGGVDAMAERAAQRAALVYDAIDGSGGFYRCPVQTESRSMMNAVWRMPTEELEKRFISEAAAGGMVGLKGHRSVGGCRASLYNAMSVEGTRALADFMKEFARKNG